MVKVLTDFFFLYFLARELYLRATVLPDFTTVTLAILVEVTLPEVATLMVEPTLGVAGVVLVVTLLAAKAGAQVMLAAIAVAVSVAMTFLNFICFLPFWKIQTFCLIYSIF